MTLKKRAVFIIVLAAAIITVRPAIIYKTKKVLFDVLALPINAARGAGKFLASKAYCIRENADLKRKNFELFIELARLQGLSKENARLRELLSFRKRVPYKTIPAEVIGRVPSAWTSSVLLNKGDKNGIRKRMAVCTSKGLAGTVIEVGTMTSKVMLVTDPNSRIGVILEGSRQTGVLTGTQDSYCKVIYLDAESVVNYGEKVYTSGIGGFLPKGLPVGTVEKVGKDVVGLYKFVTVKLYQVPNTLEEVVCIE